MRITLCFNLPLPNGLHARPASLIAEIAGRFKSAITLTNQRSNNSANAKSVLSMVGLDVRLNDPCLFSVEGPDQDSGLKALADFVKDVLPECDNSTAVRAAIVGQIQLPRSLQLAGLKNYLIGKSATSGVGQGFVVIAGNVQLPTGLDKAIAENADEELAIARRALQTVSIGIQTNISKSRHETEGEVLKAHLSIVNDVALTEKTNDLIQNEKKTAGQAIVAAGEWFAATLRNSQSAYLRERVLDIQDIISQLIQSIFGNNENVDLPLAGPSVVVANHLTPGQFLRLDRTKLKGLVLEEGGSTSHTIILARSMNIPTLLGVEGATGRVRAGQSAILDAELGILITDLSDPVLRYYQIESAKLTKLRDRWVVNRQLRSATIDGRRIEIGANIASAEEIPPAMENGAEGIGLFRTEMLFMDRDSAPSEQEQSEIYSSAARSANGRPVIIRMLDIGGDKPAAYLNMPKEDNPFLGFRGVRIYQEFSSMIKAQLRAILRAAAHGNIRILVPMISCVEEVRAVKTMLKEVQADLSAAGTHSGPTPLFGVMLEVPAAVFVIKELCQEVDFFSIGSNDLTQYFLAADRANSKVAALYSWTHPSFIRLLKKLVDEVHANGKWVGLCGEMGDDAQALPLLVGLGLDEISMSVPRMSAVKSSVSRLEFLQCQTLFTEAAACGTSAEVRSVLQQFSSKGKELPLLSSDLILQLNSVTKAETIKELCDSLQLAARVDQSRMIEQAIWQREDTYSTGFGYGFAVPHCKSDHLIANSIAIARLGNPVEWGSLDGKPVDVVILLAIRADSHGKEHMRIFSRLSRLVMRDEFRDSFRQEPDADRLLAFLKTSLG